MTIKLAILNPPTLPAKTFQTPLKLATCFSPPRGNHYPEFSVLTQTFYGIWKARNMPHQNKNCISHWLLQRGMVIWLSSSQWGKVEVMWAVSTGCTLEDGLSFSFLLPILAVGPQMGQWELEQSNWSTRWMPSRCQGCRAMRGAGPWRPQSHHSSLNCLHLHNREIFFYFV